jgi:hypothetical protein
LEAGGAHAASSNKVGSISRVRRSAQKGSVADCRAGKGNNILRNVNTEIDGY